MCFRGARPARPARPSCLSTLPWPCLWSRLVFACRVSLPLSRRSSTLRTLLLLSCHFPSIPSQQSSSSFITTLWKLVSVEIRFSWFPHSLPWGFSARTTRSGSCLDPGHAGLCFFPFHSPHVHAILNPHLPEPVEASKGTELPERSDPHFLSAPRTGGAGLLCVLGPVLQSGDSPPQRSLCCTLEPIV